MPTARLDTKKPLPPEAIGAIALRSGAHDKRGKSSVCAMELVAWLAGEEHTDSPACACPVIASFVRSWNDGLPDDATRTRLLAPFLPRIVGSRATPAVERTRSLLALDWFVREFLPTWLETVDSLRADAAKIRALAPIVDDESAETAGPVVRAARSAAESAAWSAAWSAARSAAWSAARSAAWSAAWSAAESAANRALAPTVAKLQTSAADLLDRMLLVAP